MFPSVCQKDLLAYKMHNNEKMVLYSLQIILADPVPNFVLKFFSSPNSLRFS